MDTPIVILAALVFAAIVGTAIPAFFVMAIVSHVSFYRER